MISHGPDPSDDDGVGGEEDALPLVSCDTFVAMGDVTQTGEVRWGWGEGGTTRNPKLRMYLSAFQVIFGKNSDRPKGEVQEVVFYPSKKYSSGDKLKVSDL